MKVVLGKNISNW